MILEIRRERTIELAMEGFRYYDIMRWKEGKTFEQPLLGLYIPAKGEYDIDGDGTPDVYFATKGETPSTTAKLTLVIDQDILFSDGDHGYISPHKNNPRHLGRNPRLFLSDSDRRPLADGRRPDPEPRMERRTEFLTAKQTEKCWNS